VCASTPGVTRTRQSRGRCEFTSFQQFDLVEVVNDQSMDAFVQGAFHLLTGLVVAVHDHPACGHPGAQHDIELTAGRDIDTEALFEGQAGHRPAQEGFRREGHAVVEGPDGFATASP
jgi:hypothetical protein